MKRLRISLNIIFAFLICFACLGIKNNYAYAVTEYNVTYHKLDGSTEISSTIDGFAIEPEDLAQEGYKTIWYYNVLEGEQLVEYPFDFGQVLQNDIELYAKEVKFFKVNYYKYTDISQGLDSQEYTLFTTIDVMQDAYATTIEPNSELGYDFLYWTSDYNTKLPFDFSQNKIYEDINLYPVYSLKTFDITYLVDDEIYTIQTVNYNTVTSQPEIPQKEGFEFVGWYILSEQSDVEFEFDTAILKDYTLVAKFIDLRYNITYANSPYASFDGASQVQKDEDLVFYVTIANYYNQNTITLEDLIIQGTFDSSSIEFENGKYIVTLYQVASNINVDIKALAVNKYKVTLPNIEGVAFEILTSNNDYTFDGTYYNVNYGRAFRFKVIVGEGYFAKTISFSGVSVSGDIYTVNNNMADINIISNCDIVQYATITFANTEFVNYNIETEVLQKQDDVVFVQLGTSTQFTATAQTGYYVLGVDGANKVADKYVFNAQEDKTLVFNVVSYVTVTLPEITGVASYTVMGGLFNQDNNYAVQVGNDLTITINLLFNYSDSDVNLLAQDLQVEKTNNVFVIKNITKDIVVEVLNVQLNSFNIIDQLDSSIGYMVLDYPSIEFGQNLQFSIVLTDAYNKTAIDEQNFIISGSYSYFTVLENIVTVYNVQSDISIQLADFTKNTYSITFIENTYGKLISNIDQLTHGDNITVYAQFTSKYDKAILKIDYIDITDGYESYTEKYGEVTFIGVKKDLVLSLKDVPINYYRVTMPYQGLNVFTVNKSDQSLPHGSNLNFTLTLSRAYSQSIETLTLYANANEIYGVIDGLTITYSLTNIIEDIVLTVSPLSINTYEIYYKDGDNVLFIRIENDGVTPTQPSNPTKIGFDFAGWYLDKELQTEFDFNNYVISNSISIYAKFIINEYTIKFSIDGAIVDYLTVEFGTDISNNLPQIPSKTGYSKVEPYWDFESVDCDPNYIQKDAVVNAVYLIDTYTVKFVAFGNVIDTQQVEYLLSANEPQNKEIQGYTFVGWDNVFDKVTQDLVINGIYQINSYKVWFVDVKDNMSNIYYQTIDYNMTADKPSDSFILSNKTGYTVYGWYKDEGLTQLFDFSTPITNDTYIYGDIDITILYVTFYINNVQYEQFQVEYGNSLEDIPQIPSKEGYTQIAPYWSVEDFTNITNDINCEAVYTINVYTITFIYPNGDTFTTTVNHGETLTDLPNKNLRFGQTLSVNKDLLKNITQDLTINLKIKDYLALIIIAIVIVGGGLIALIVILSIKIKKARNTSNKEIQKMQQKIDERQAYINRMQNKK